MSINPKAASTGLSFCTLFLAFSTAYSQPSFVASNGSDANPCTRAAPCRSLQAAHDVASDGGEIQILDSGEYSSPLTITKSITISADGLSAIIRHPNNVTRAITINHPLAKVVLRGLSLSGGGTGRTGIHVSAAGYVNIDRCRIEGFGLGPAISLEFDNPVIAISDTIVRDSLVGLLVHGGLQPATLIIRNSRFDNNQASGLSVGGMGALSQIIDSSSSGNGGTGFSLSQGRTIFIRATAANNGGDGYHVSGGEMTLERSVARGNSTGINVNLTSFVVLSNSAVTNNRISGIANSSSSVRTRGNNTIAGNSTDLVGDPLIVLPDL